MVVGTEPDCSECLYHVDLATIIVPAWPILLLHYGSLCLDLLLKELGLNMLLILWVTIGVVRYNILAGILLYKL